MVRCQWGISVFRQLCLTGLTLFSVTIYGNQQALDCGGLKPGTEKVFQPLAILDPATGKPFAKNADVVITLPDGSKKTVKAGDLEAQINDLEKRLAASGRSVYDGDLGPDAIKACSDQMVPIEDLQILSANPNGTSVPPLSEEEWNQEWDQRSLTQSSSLTLPGGGGFPLPGGDTGGGGSGSGKSPVILPKLPDLAEPDLAWDRAKLKVILDKAWGFEIGNKKKFYTGIFPYIQVNGSPIEVVAQGGARWRAAILGKWDGELAHAYAHGASPGSGSAFAEVAVEVMGGLRVWAKPLVSTDPIRISDKYKVALEKHLDFPFVVGPLPMKARIGIQGEAGIKYNVQVFTLQVGAFTVPWAGAEVYAQVGGDIGAFGAGLGGTLVLVKDSIVVQGRSLFEYKAQPQLSLMADVTNKADALTGEIYAFGYTFVPIPKPPFLKKWEMRFPLFKHEGYHFEQALLHLDKVIKVPLPKKS